MPKPQPSSTAWLVGAATAYVALDPKMGKLVPPAAVQPTLACLRSAGGLKARTVGWFARPWFRKRAAAYESRRLPGFSLHIAARKRAIEDAARKAITGDGYRQLVVLGAGYDTLALRVHQDYPKLPCLEIDQAPTQRVKLSAAMARELPSPTLGLIPADLARQELLETLSTSPVYKPTLDTVFIAEGLLMYLSAEAVSGLFAAIRLHEAKRVRVIFTFLEPGPGGNAHFPGASAAAQNFLRKRGEPLRWGLRRNEAQRWLEERGFNVQDLAGPQTFRQRYLAGIVGEDVPLAAGEFVCVAERDESRKSERGSRT